MAARATCSDALSKDNGCGRAGTTPGRIFFLHMMCCVASTDHGVLCPEVHQVCILRESATVADDTVAGTCLVLGMAHKCHLYGMHLGLFCFELLFLTVSSQR